MIRQAELWWKDRNYGGKIELYDHKNRYYYGELKADGKIELYGDEMLATRQAQVVKRWLTIYSSRRIRASEPPHLNASVMCFNHSPV